MRILSSRDMVRLENAVRKIERLKEINDRRRPAIYSGSVGGTSDHFNVTPTSRVALSVDTDTYLDRDTHENKILYQGASASNRFIYLPSNPQVGDTYRFVVANTESVYIKMTNDDHGIAGPFPWGDYSFGLNRYPYSEDYIHAYWFDWLKGPATVYHYSREWINLSPMGDSGDMVHWLVLTYTGEQRTTPSGYDDIDADGGYWDSSWGPDYVHNPLVYKTITLWMVRMNHGHCLPMIGEQSYHD